MVYLKKKVKNKIYTWAKKKETFYDCDVLENGKPPKMVVKERVWNLLLGVIFMNLLVLLGYSENMEKGVGSKAGILYNDDTTFGKLSSSLQL